MTNNTYFLTITAQEKIAIDSEGYLKKLSDWSTIVAEKIALSEGISLTQAHWDIVNLMQQYYNEFDLSPEMRPFINYLKKNNSDKAKSVYLLSLFPQSPMKIGCKIAGLPKPDNCL
jgi:tRNA 2-thiouridine synthesizing protein E